MAYIEDIGDSVAFTLIGRLCVVVKFIDAFGEVFYFPLVREVDFLLLTCY